ncbi:hypothetical protein [Mesoterricola silvestris]|uniref:Uncharacterized protein n=1 Tax=Mesoterricola silvestris TaxID=2927979 RepID=A0AA48GV25_9BACT|nr:hypothetical protein [Mesoterricola silvestris]BDU70858.1 hypothetical protein METEAL_00320 [Mesoterricola silvestris]
MSNQYHDTLQPPYRIQKRLVLNQCFRSVKKQLKPGADLISYVTFGGAELYDLMDLLAVFDLRKRKFLAFSFELEEDLAQKANNCVVAKALRLTKRVHISVIQGDFAIDFGKLGERQAGQNFIFFLDYTECFAQRHQGAIESLLKFNLLRAGDFLIITSCLVPRVMHQPTFMEDKLNLFSDYFHVDEGDIDTQFKVRNHVDLLVGQAFLRNTGGVHASEKLSPALIEKYKYRDTNVPMGLWAFAVQKVEREITGLNDHPFDEFPWIPAPEAEETLPLNLFPDL